MEFPGDDHDPLDEHDRDPDPDPSSLPYIGSLGVAFLTL